MIREHVFSGSTPSDKFFRWRGGEVSRLENLSDVVFALCLTMLVAVPTARADLAGERRLEGARGRHDLLPASTDPHGERHDYRRTDGQDPETVGRG